jgi:hypothetical protein|tara:strand:- start:112 stop:291 length:180 start_codon:yes stop_codon:yes gene_type:complete
MERKIVKNGYQHRLNIPQEIIDSLKLDKNSKVTIREVDTPEGKGFVVIPVKKGRQKISW